MSWKPTWILILAAAVLFAFIWFVDRPIRQERLRQASRIILPGFDPASVKTIEIKPRGAADIQVVRAEGTNMEWRMTEPIAYPTEPVPIILLLNALARLGWQERISANELRAQADAQEKFGFTEPQFEISLQGSGPPRKVLIGQSSALGDQVFLEVVGSPDIYLVNADWLPLIPSDKDQWRDLSIIDTSHLDFQSIQVRSPGRGFDLQLNPTNHLWLMTQPVTARADSAKINNCLKKLAALQVRQFVSDDPRVDLELYGLQASPQTPDLDVSFWKGTNLAADLQIGGSPTNMTNMAFARRADPSNVVVIDRDPIRPWQGAYTNFLDYHFISVSPETIGLISVQADGQFYVEKQTNGQWMVHAAATYPADAELMRDWLATFTNYQTQIEKTIATDFTEYGLNHPLLQYTLQSPGQVPGSSNGIIAQIQFGSNRSGQIFERRPDESFVNVVKPDDFYSLPRSPWQLRDRHIWSFESSNVLSLTVEQQGVTRKFVRDPEGEWTFAPGFHGPPEVNWPSLAEGIHRLGQLQAVYWDAVGNANEQAYGFAKANFKISIAVKNGSGVETNSIEFGGRSPYTYPYAAVERNGERLIFEFPVDLYENFVERDMAIPAALRYHP